MMTLTMVMRTKQRVLLPPMRAERAIHVFLNFKLGSSWPSINGRKMHVLDIELSCL